MLDIIEVTIKCLQSNDKNVSLKTEIKKEKYDQVDSVNITSAIASNTSTGTRILPVFVTSGQF